eukprot:5306985-Lingulodinium_polyedra.AAC.1
MPPIPGATVLNTALLRGWGASATGVGGGLAAGVVGSSGSFGSVGSSRQYFNSHHPAHPAAASTRPGRG